MKQIVLALLLLAMNSGFVLAETFNGTVQQLDRERRVITLDRGRSWTIPKRTGIPEGLKVGDRVSLTSEGDDRDQIDQIYILRNQRR